MDFRQLRYFTQIVELGSFGKAAAILRIAQPALSNQIRNLEEELGVQLLIRHASGIVPTKAGLTLNEAARNILRLLDEARQATIDQAQTITGTVTVGLTPSLCSTLGARIVKRIHAESAGVSVVLMESLSITLQEWLLTGQIDLAVMHNPQPTKLMLKKLLLKEDLLLVGRADDARLPDRLANVGDLADWPLIVPPPPNSITQLAQEAVAQAGRVLNVAYHINTLSTIIDLVHAGLGYSILPLISVHREVAAGTLKACVVPDPSLRRSLVLTWPTQRPVSRAVAHTKRCIETLIAEFDREIDWSHSRIVDDREDGG